MSDLAESKESEESKKSEEFKELVSEADALATYIAQQGDSIPDDGQLREELFKAVSEAKSKYSLEKYQPLMSAYAKVTAITYKERGVNGRTILDTQRKNRNFVLYSTSVSRRPMMIGIFLFVVALLLEASMGWQARFSDPEVELAGGKLLCYHMLGALYPLLLPAIWGGIGSCIFLAKRISDELFDMSYERSRQRGTYSRIFLGSILGVVTVSLFFPELKEQKITAGSINLRPATLAFVSGLGVKPIYGAFESLSKELARRIKGTGSSDGGSR